MAIVITKLFPLIPCLKPRKLKWSNKRSPPQLQTLRDESHGLDRGGVCQVKSNYSLPLPLEKERKSRSVKAGFK